MELLWVYTHVYNEIKMLPYFLRHYLTVADRITFFVQQDSDDGTQAYLEEQHRLYPNIVYFESLPVSGLDDLALVEFANYNYRRASHRSRWGMWPDVDEIIWHPDLRERLKQYDHAKPVPVVVAPGNGWVMSHPTFPTTDGQIYDEVRHGRQEDNNMKPVIFDPRTILSWAAGKHRMENAVPVARDMELWMLHFRFMGLEYHLDRNHRNWARIPANCHRYHLGDQTNPANDSHDTESFNIRLKEDRELPW